MTNKKRKACFIEQEDDNYKKYVIICDCLEPPDGTENYKYNNQEPCYIFLKKDTIKAPKFCPICGKKGVVLISMGSKVMNIGGIY
jgi:hypothetical protein